MKNSSIQTAFRKDLEIALRALSMDEWVSISLRNKGVSESDPASSDEWIFRSFPYCHLLDIKTKGLPEIPGPIKTRKNGTLVLQVFPQTFYEKIFFGGITYEVWLQPEETLETLKPNQAKMRARIILQAKLDPKKADCRLNWGMPEKPNAEDLIPMLADIARDRPDIISAKEFRKILIEMGLALDVERALSSE
jgi:hypothetical protein